MLANWITLSRFPLLLISIMILYLGGPVLRLVGVGLLFVGLMLDTVDGIVARRTGHTSLFGSVLDIAADRTYELVLWACFADLQFIPVAIPIIVIARTTLTDAFRSIGVREGTAPFDQIPSKVGAFLVGSPPMRIGYSTAKIVTFCGLALAQAFSDFPPGSFLKRLEPTMLTIFGVTAWVAVGFCVFRGLPVIITTLRRYWGEPGSGAAA